jgi:hypothetical protein
MENKSYIGELEVISVTGAAEGEGEVYVTLKEGDKEKGIVMKQALFDLIVKPVQGNGNVTDSVYAYIAEEFLHKLAEYGMERFQLEGIASAMGNLAHNWTEDKIGKFFNCQNSDHIKIADLIC